MGVADANNKLIYIDVGCNGRISDGGVFNNCSLYDALESKQLPLPEPEALPQRCQSNILWSQMMPLLWGHTF